MKKHKKDNELEKEIEHLQFIICTLKNKLDTLQNENVRLVEKEFVNNKKYYNLFIENYRMKKIYLDRITLLEEKLDKLGS